MTQELDGNADNKIDSSLLVASLETLATAFTPASASSAASLALAEDTDNGTHKVTLSAPAALAADYTLTLPTTDGDANQVLQTDGSGNTSWVTPSAGGGETISSFLLMGA